MSDNSKRLDLRFGAFACSVQGFEDPVQPVQQVLRALQTLLEESPGLAETGIVFDAEAIEQLTGEVARRAELAESDVEITPGLVIVYRGEAGAAGLDAGFAVSEAGDESAGEEWARPFLHGEPARNGHDTEPEFGAEHTAAEAPEADGDERDSPEFGDRAVGAGSFGGRALRDRAFGERRFDDRDGDHGEGAEREPEYAEAAGAESAESAHGGYVNIFAPRPGGHAGGSLFGGASGPSGHRADDPGAGEPGAGADDIYPSRRGESDDGGDGGEDGLSRDIFADDDRVGGDVNIFADPMAAGDDDDLEEPLNLFGGSHGGEAADEAGHDSGGADHRRGGRLVPSFELRSRLRDSMSPPETEMPLPEEPGDEPAPAEADPFTPDKLAKAAEAQTVEDLMVCAAAWMVLMKGQTKFGRRDVLEIFDKLPGEHPRTLEAKIKGFGKAVRNGHLIPIGDGVFGLARTNLEDFQRLL